MIVEHLDHSIRAVSTHHDELVVEETAAADPRLPVNVARLIDFLQNAVLVDGIPRDKPIRGGQSDTRVLLTELDVDDVVSGKPLLREDSIQGVGVEDVERLLVRGSEPLSAIGEPDC